MNLETKWRELPDQILKEQRADWLNPIGSQQKNLNQDYLAALVLVVLWLSRSLTKVAPLPIRERR